jgi:CRP/FNR family transcriptional activator FtrB
MLRGSAQRREVAPLPQSDDAEPGLPLDSGLLHDLPLFAGVDPAVISAIAAAAEERDYARDEIIIEQGGSAEYLHILVEGQIGYTARSSDGKTTVVEVGRPIDTFFIAAVMSQAPHITGAIALEPCRLIRIPATVIRRLADEHPPLLRTMLHIVGQQFRLLVGQVKDLKLRSSTQRLGCYLLALAREHRADGKGEFRLPYDKRLLAGRLGMTPENLSRAFGSLREYGVETHGSRVALHDPAALETFAAPDFLR